MWWWWQKENNRNLVVVLYSSSIHEAFVEKKLSLGSMQGRYEVNVFVDGKIYGINEEVEKEENNKIMEDAENQD